MINLKVKEIDTFGISITKQLFFGIFFLMRLLMHYLRRLSPPSPASLAYNKNMYLANVLHLLCCIYLVKIGAKTMI